MALTSIPELYSYTCTTLSISTTYHLSQLVPQQYYHSVIRTTMASTSTQRPHWCLLACIFLHYWLMIQLPPLSSWPSSYHHSNYRRSFVVHIVSTYLVAFTIPPFLASSSTHRSRFNLSFVSNKYFTNMMGFRDFILLFCFGPLNAINYLIYIFLSNLTCSSLF